MDETFKRIIGEYYDSIDDDHIFDRETFIQIVWVANAFSIYTGHRDLKNKVFDEMRPV